MNTSDLVLDLPSWLSWASNALYAACVVLAVFALVAVCCIVVQSLHGNGHLKKRTHLPH